MYAKEFKNLILKQNLYYLLKFRLKHTGIEITPELINASGSSISRQAGFRNVAHSREDEGERYR